jgi:hypothetical protein
MRRWAVLTALAAIAVSVPLTAVAADDDALPPLTPRGFGAIKVGMTLAEAQRAGGRKITGFPALPGSPCRIGRIARVGVLIMFIDGRAARFDIARGSRVHALRNIRRGDKEADVRAAFGKKVVETRHFYTPGGSYLTVGWRTGPNAGRGIRFATNERGTVTDIYAGRSREIRYIEGCS